MTRGQPSGKGQPSAHDRGTANEDDALARELSGLARRLQGEDDPGLMLDEIVRAAVELIPGVDEGSISVVTGRRQVTSLHSSGALPTRVDAVQEEVGEGPCISAAFEHVTVRVPDMEHEDRWPRRAAPAPGLADHRVTTPARDP